MMWNVFFFWHGRTRTVFVVGMEIHHYHCNNQTNQPTNFSLQQTALNINFFSVHSTILLITMLKIIQKWNIVKSESKNTHTYTKPSQFRRERPPAFFLFRKISTVANNLLGKDVGRKISFIQSFDICTIGLLVCVLVLFDLSRARFFFFNVFSGYFCVWHGYIRNYHCVLG